MPPAAAFKSVELYDHDALKLIISNWEVIPLDPEAKKDWKFGRKPISPLASLNKYLFNSRVDKLTAYATHSTLYYYSSNSANEGRKYAKDACSLQSFARPIRHTLAHKYYDDIDIVNAHPTFLLQYCEKKGYDVKFLKKYVDNRDEKLSQLMSLNNITREHAKQVVLAILNGGFKDYDALEHKPAWLSNLKLQINNIHTLIMNDRDNERFVARAKNTVTKAGSACNHLLCYIEDSILTACMKFLEKKGIKTDNVVLVFDGFMLPKNTCNLNHEFFTEMTEYIKTTCGYVVEFAIKHMDEVMDLSGFTLSNAMTNDMAVVEDDNEAADVFIERYSNVVKRSNGRLFAYNYNNTWTCDVNIVDTLLLNICLQSKIFKTDAKGNPKPYSGNVSGAKHVIEAVKAKLVDDPQFSKMLWGGSIGKLFFANGYYDFCRREFHNSVSPQDSLTTIRLSFAFPQRDEQMMQEVRERVLASIFPDPNVRETFLAHIARAIAGHFEDKDWCVGIGERNSGKGVLVGLNENGFEDYCITLNSDSFLLERMGDGDQAKKLSWLLDCEYKRLMFTNEITIEGNTKKLNGNVIKGKLTSGGDTLKARKNYMNEVEFKIQGRLIMLCNDLPPISPPDAVETMTVFNFPNQFVEDPKADLPFQKERDDDMKDYCRLRTVCDAYIHLVLDAYKPTRVIPCSEVRSETLTFRAEAGDEWGLLKASFTVSKNDKDRVASKDVLKWAKGKQLNVSSQKLRHRLEKMGAVYCDHVKIDGKTTSGYKYLSFVDSDANEIDSDDM